MSLRYARIATLNERKTMCNLCYAKQNNISAISTSPSTLCSEHYFEWATEKGHADLDMSEDYFHLV